jgi:S-adenosyl methyltransferase
MTASKPLSRVPGTSTASGPDRDTGAPVTRPLGTSVPFDTSVPNVARMYNALLGGKDNFAADRAAVSKILEIEPGAAAAALQNRDFLRRTVRFLAGEAGIGQFLDIGAGLPAAGSVHEVAQSLAPASRVVYVDHDPVVLSHARALLVPGPQGGCAYAGCDLRDTRGLIAQAARTLDFAEPVAVLLIAVLHFIPDADDPQGIVRRLMAAVPPGSYLVISHATPEHLADGASTARLNAVYAQTASGGVTPRPLPEITKFFDRLDLVDPGVADICAWRPAVHRAGPGRGRTLFYGGAARKPASAGASRAASRAPVSPPDR